MGEMEKDKILEQLVAIVAEMQELCAVLRQNTVLSKDATADIAPILLSTRQERC
jgi:hypothetical protein